MTFDEADRNQLNQSIYQVIFVDKDGVTGGILHEPFRLLSEVGLTITLDEMEKEHRTVRESGSRTKPMDWIGALRAIATTIQGRGSTPGKMVPVGRGEPRWPVWQGWPALD
jgi:hypothetical protein